MQARVLLDGLAMPESPRWHHGRLWFSNWGTRQIVAVDLNGNSDVVGEGPDGLGWATNWLPDGRLLITGPELIRVEPDGSRVRHANLSRISPLGWSEITVDGAATSTSTQSTSTSPSYEDMRGAGVVRRGGRAPATRRRRAERGAHLCWSVSSLPPCGNTSSRRERRPNDVD